jgi:DNA-binding NarL/FixJ family response regulator
MAALGAGEADKLVGSAVCLTEFTVKSHIPAILKKMGVVSRTEAIAVADRRGLLHLQAAVVVRPDRLFIRSVLPLTMR